MVAAFICSNLLVNVLSKIGHSEWVLLYFLCQQSSGNGFAMAGKKQLAGGI